MTSLINRPSVAGLFYKHLCDSLIKVVKKILLQDVFCLGHPNTYEGHASLTKNEVFQELTELLGISIIHLECLAVVNIVST